MKPRVQKTAQKSQWALYFSLIHRGEYLTAAEETCCPGFSTLRVYQSDRRLGCEGLLSSCWSAFRHQTLGAPKINILNLFQYYDF